MAYAYQNLKITFGGKLHQRNEIWTNGITLGHEDKDFDGFPEQIDRNSYNDIVQNIKDWFQRNSSRISNGATLEWVKFAVVGTDGKYAATSDGNYALNVTYDFDPIYGADASTIAPQLSVALTMETDVRRGAGRYGRIYPPLTGTPGGDGYDQYTTERAESFKELLDDINDSSDGLIGAADNAPRVVIASAVGQGRNASVKRVKVGRVIDTQRSRRNAMVEDYKVLELDDDI